MPPLSHLPTQQRIALTPASTEADPLVRLPEETLLGTEPVETVQWNIDNTIPDDPAQAARRLRRHTL
jgi:hypothetical protein